MQQNITFWTTIITTAIGVITSIWGVVASKKKSKNQKFVELAKIVKKLPGYITESETIFGGGHGVAKISYVLNKVQMDCLRAKVEYNEEQFKGEIENILSTPQKKEKQE